MQLSSLRRILAMVAISAALCATDSRLNAQSKGRINPLISKLEQGQTALTPTDWTFIDMEHGPYLLDRLQSTLEGLAKRRKADGQFESARSCVFRSRAMRISGS